MASENQPQSHSTVKANDPSNIRSALNKLMQLLAKDIARRLRQAQSPAGNGPTAKSIDDSHDLP